MQLTIGGVVTFMGLLAGLNFFGLFLAVWMMDRTARHLAFYVGCTVFFGLSALFDISVLSGGLPMGAASLSKVMDTAAFVLAARGMSMDFRLRIPDWQIYALAGLGLLACLLQAVIQPPQESWRLSGIAISHGLLMLLVAQAALRALQPQRVVRVIGAFSLVFALNFLAFQPFIAFQIDGAANLTGLQKLDAFISVTNTVFVVFAFATGAVLFFHTMNRLVVAYRSASLTDPLTGLWNRRGFFAAMPENAAQPACIIMADIDHFKQINDLFGHDAGDETIVGVASTLRAAALETTVYGRLGGEEFGIFLPNTPLAAGHAYANALRMAIEAGVHSSLPRGYKVTASLGVCEITDGDTRNGLRRADAALYLAKNSGRNLVCRDTELPQKLEAAA
jgi:diguanylate cyclase (GGDEF)-like protein